MFTEIDTSSITRSQVVEQLAKLREQWEQVSEGHSLVNISGSVGLILADVAISLDLNREEQLAALGPRLRHEYFRFVRANG